MKSMLYVGAALMVGASIYGFVDYKQTQEKKEFKEMYTEKKTVPAPVVSEEEEKMKAPANTEAKTKPATVKKRIKVVKDDIVSVQPIAEEDKMVAGETEIVSETEMPVPAEESSVVKSVKKKRKISSKLFSRAPLREEIEIAPAKKEVKKTESKEL